MEEKVVDARGQVCPKPLILTKQALKEIAPGQGIRILIDNSISKQNVERFLLDNGIRSATSESDGVYSIFVNSVPTELSHPDAASYCKPEKVQSVLPHTVVIKSDKMGNGPDELGSILIKAFINTIKEVSPLPSNIVFYNTGILLTVNSSPVAESIRELESKGVQILICGTCVEYFKKRDEIKVGIISNMYTILEKLTEAGHIITP